MHLLDLLRRDINATKGALKGGGLQRDFWLWKVCMGAQGIAMMAKQRVEIETGIDNVDELLSFPKAWFDSRLRLWSVASGVKTWAEVKKALHIIVWLGLPGDTVMEDVWAAAVPLENEAF